MYLQYDNTCNQNANIILYKWHLVFTTLHCLARESCTIFGKSSKKPTSLLVHVAGLSFTNILCTKYDKCEEIPKPIVDMTKICLHLTYGVCIVIQMYILCLDIELKDMVA